MKNRRFQICLVALSLGLILTLNSCNKSNSVAPQITEPSSPIQVDEVKANTGAVFKVFNIFPYNSKERTNLYKFILFSE